MHNYDRMLIYSKWYSKFTGNTGKYSKFTGNEM